MANIQDVARLAGVNASTVSRVLNGSAPIREDTRQRVLAAVEKLQYRHVSRGRTETNARMKVAGVVIPDLASPYYTSLANALCDAFAAKGYCVQLYTSDFDQKRILNAIDCMMRIRVSCMLIIMDSHEAISGRLVQSLQHSTVPVMIITGKYETEIGQDCLYVDGKRGAAMAAEHLVHRGYRRIGFVGEYRSRSRLADFEEALAVFGLHLNPEFVCMGEERGELGGYLRMKELLKRDKLPDAVFAGYDQVAMGVIHALNESGLRIPGDMAVIGFDNIPAAQYLSGGLTTVGTLCADMASIAVRILLHKVAAPFTPSQQVALNPVLHVRSTT